MGEISKSKKVWLVDDFPNLKKTKLGQILKGIEAGMTVRGYPFEYLNELEKQAINPSYSPNWDLVPIPRRFSVGELMKWWDGLPLPKFRN